MGNKDGNSNVLIGEWKFSTTNERTIPMIYPTMIEVLYLDYKEYPSIWIIQLCHLSCILDSDIIFFQPDRYDSRYHVYISVYLNISVCIDFKEDVTGKQLQCRGPSLLFDKDHTMVGAMKNCSSNFENIICCCLEAWSQIFFTYAMV